MTSSTPLPVGVLLPTRNVREGLPRHLDAMERWLPLVEEVVVVDSESGDGTVEYLRERLRHPRVRFLTHPPGLYESWNFGLQQLHTEWAYVSTIGDIAPARTLERLVAEGRRWEADVVVSAPRFVGPGASRSSTPWPVQRLIERWQITEPCVLSGWEVFLWTALHVPGGMLGSSSSNLYRTRLLQEHPFPTGYRHAGDTGWAIENAFRARFVVAPGLESEFVKHAPTHRPARERPGATRRRLHQRAQEVFAEQSGVADAAGDAREWAAPMDAYWQAADRLLDANELYHDLRKGTALSLLRPSLWRARWRRAGVRREVDLRRAEVLRRLDLLHARRARPV